MIAIKMNEVKWHDPPGWTIGNWSDMTPGRMRGYSEEFLDYVSLHNGGGWYDTWARAEIARRQSVRLGDLITTLKQATERVQTEVTDFTTSSTQAY
jgi:hypothetical protein